MPAFESARQPDVIEASSDRKFGFVAGGASLIIGLWPLHRGDGPHWWAVGWFGGRTCGFRET
jgi:hypothetical protein